MWAAVEVAREVVKQVAVSLVPCLTAVLGYAETQAQSIPTSQCISLLDGRWNYSSGLSSVWRVAVLVLVATHTTPGNSAIKVYSTRGCIPGLSALYSGRCCGSKF